MIRIIEEVFIRTTSGTCSVGIDVVVYADSLILIIMMRFITDIVFAIQPCAT